MKKIRRLLCILLVMVFAIFFAPISTYAVNNTYTIPEANEALNLPLVDVGTPNVKLIWNSLVGDTITSDVPFYNNDNSYVVTHYGVSFHAYGENPPEGADFNTSILSNNTNVPDNIVPSNFPPGYDPEQLALSSLIAANMNEYNNRAAADNIETHLWVCFWIANYHGDWYPSWRDLGVYENMENVIDSSETPTITDPSDVTVDSGENAEFTVAATVSDGELFLTNGRS